MQKSDMQLIISPEYEKLVPEMSKQAYEELKESIIKNGLYDPITINNKGVLLDGHHRYRIWTELKKEGGIPSRIKDFETPLNERRFVIESNLRRRHLEPYQKAALGRELEKIEIEEAKLRQIEAGGDKKSKGDRLSKKLDKRSLTPAEIAVRREKAKLRRQRKKEEEAKNPKPKPEKSLDKKTGKRSTKSIKEGQALEKVSKFTNLSAEMQRQYDYVLDNGWPELIEEMTHGITKITKAYSTLKHEEERKKLEVEAKRLEEEAKKAEKEARRNKPFNILNCDLNDPSISDIIEKNSISIIDSDPPYGEANLDCYSKLGKFAMDYLVDGGSLIVYTGQLTLDSVIERLKSVGLKYWWTFSIYHTGGNQAIHPRGVFAEWKPRLWFIKGDKRLNKSEYLRDSIDSTKPDKATDEWAQSPIESEYVIEHLTVKGQTVVDPFCGSGTAGIAALKLGRKFVGIDIDKSACETAENRLTILAHKG
jgi:16S rRNA G966 N2-methylase RsmD